jgi:transcriptional regulator with XRE-family HTH domain
MVEEVMHMARLRVKEVLEERQLSVDGLYRLIITKFGTDVDISKNTISTMINNSQHRPNMRKLEIIAQTLGIKISDLIDESNSQPSINES